MSGQMRVGLGFILEVPTGHGPLYVQWLSQDGEHLGRLTDDPSQAYVFRAEAVACDQAYFIIEPRVPGSIWQECRPVPVFEEVVPRASRVRVSCHRPSGSVGRFWRWVTWRREGC